MFETFDDFLEFNDSVTDDSSGGLIGLVSYQVGWKAFVAGHGDDTSFFPVSGKDEYASQKKAAQDFIALHGAGGKPSYGFLLTVYKGETLSKDSSGWKADLSKFTADWTAATKEVVLPALKEIGVLPGVRFYAMVSWKPDPYKVKLGDAGKTDFDKDGNPAYPTVMYFSRKFDSKEEAMKAVNSATTPAASTTPTAPTGGKPAIMVSEFAANNGWTMELLFENRKVFDDAINKLVSDGKPLPVARAQVAKEYSVDVSDLVILDSTPF